jgi:hypothetical protein
MTAMPQGIIRAKEVMEKGEKAISGPPMGNL